jgi:hypothetical protein
MVTDAVLWFLLLAVVGWITCGCLATRPRPIRQRYDERPRDQHGPGSLEFLTPPSPAGR